MTPAQERRLTEAKLVMLRRMPYYGTFIIGMEFVEDKNIPTAATDYRSIKYNPDWLCGLDDNIRPRQQTVFVLGHEVLHISFKHGLRMGYRDPKLWNVACDYAINGILREGEVGEHPPADAAKGEVQLFDPKFDGMAAEQIYDILEKEAKKQAQQQGGGQGGQGGNGLPDKFKHGGVIIDLRKQDPGGTGGFERPINADGSELTDAQKAELERDVDGKTSASAAAAKQQGKLPAGLERLLQTAMTPIVDWRDRLRQFVSKLYPSDYSWSKPARRHLWADLYLPHVTKSGVGEILTIMDTSGSVDYSGSTSEGAQYWAEIKNIFEDCMPERLHVMYCDAEVAGHDTFEQGEEPVLKPRGGGGTDFRPPFQKVDKQGLNIQCAIYLTDGYGTFPEKPLPYPVLWVITTDVVPPWGTHIKLVK